MASRLSRPPFLAGGLHQPDCPLVFVPTDVTDPLAAKLLDNLHPDQRGAKPGKVNVFAADMLDGRWRRTHECVAVDSDGLLVDGQNRMLAVRKAASVRPDIRVPMVICYGVEPPTLAVINTGAGRTALDASRVAGLGVPNSAYCAVARQMAAGTGLRRQAWSVQQSLDLVASYREALNFAFSITSPPVRGVTVAGVRAAVARAWYTADRKRLADFGAQLRTGLVDDPRTDAAAVLLRNWLLEQEISSSKGARALTAGYATFALAAFLLGERPQKLALPAKDPFPIPEPSRYDSD